MPRSSSWRDHLDWRSLRAQVRNRASAVRLGLLLLLGLNIGMLYMVFHPPGGTLEDLEDRIVSTRQQILQRQQGIARLKQTIARMTQARGAGEAFLDQYFLPRKHAYSQLEVELDTAAKTASIKSKDRTYSYEPVEGSDTLGMLTITANFEGTYADLIAFVNQLDRSNRLLIIESMQAQPVQGTPVLAINMKIDAFFRFEGAQDASAPATLAGNAVAPAGLGEVRR
jgi:Tfp pilus assembly protein PilO